MQDSHFQGRHAGCDNNSGLTFPELEKIASAYSIPYFRIDSADTAEKVIKDALTDYRPAIIEMITPMNIEFLPVVKSKMDVSGNMTTPSLELMYPFLSDEEHLENIRISKRFPMEKEQ